MIQLSYQPAFDPFHTVFRMLRLFNIIASVDSLPEDHVRIMDFYLLFPFRSAAIRLTPQHRRFHKISENYSHKKSYSKLPDDIAIFRRMAPIQAAAFATLVDKKLIDSDAWSSGLIKRTIVHLSVELAARVDQINADESELIEFIGVLGKEYKLPGQGGLKERTGLMEYRYDAI